MIYGTGHCLRLIDSIAPRRWRQAQDGLYSKASQALVSLGVAPNYEETWMLLVSKHPKSECPIAPMPKQQIADLIFTLANKITLSFQYLH